MVQRIWLESLADNTDVVTREAAGFYKENCMMCFDNQGHTSGVTLLVQYDRDYTFTVGWLGEVTEVMRRSYVDMTRATEYGALTIALILVRELTEYTVVEQSAIGTTIDYYLSANPDPEDDLIFNHTARLEVSGILRENRDNSVDQRVSEKRRRLKPENDLRTLIVIVEFGKPWSKMVTV